MLDGVLRGNHDKLVKMQEIGEEIGAKTCPLLS